MAYTTVNKSTDHFSTTTYTGNGSVSTALTTGTFQPDWVWFKNRGTTEAHLLMDACRGATKYIQSASTAAEGTSSDKISAFTSTGVTLGSGPETNENSQPLVCWSWKANGQGSSNTSGTINSTYTSANTTSGFSIITYTGDGNSGATIGHGLGVAPKLVMIKKLNGADAWFITGTDLGWNKYLSLNANSAESGSSNNSFTGTAATTTVFSVGSDSGVNGNGDTYVAYVFAEKTGFSKFGIYTGNGNTTNPPFIYTGFKPHWVLTKANAASESWQITDLVRDNAVGGGNGTGARLIANSTAAESTNTTWAAVHKFSNGFSPQHNDGVTNMDGRTYLYIAFGQSLVGSNNTPCTAR